MSPIMSVDLSAPVTLLSFILSVDEKRRYFLLSPVNMPGKTDRIGVCLHTLMGALPIREAHQKD